jgi:hypothetical protein
MIIEQKTYTHKVKLSTLRLLEKNDFNYLKTEKLTCVSRSTLKKWQIQYGTEVFSGKSPAEVALKEIDAELTRNDIKVIRMYYLIRIMILDRIMQLVPDETRLDPRISTFKSITEEISVFDPNDNKEDRTSNFIAILNHKIQLQDHESQFNTNKTDVSCTG